MRGLGGVRQQIAAFALLLGFLLGQLIPVRIVFGGGPAESSPGVRAPVHLPLSSARPAEAFPKVTWAAVAATPDPPTSSTVPKPSTVLMTEVTTAAAAKTSSPAEARSLKPIKIYQVAEACYHFACWPFLHLEKIGTKPGEVLCEGAYRRRTCACF